MVKIIPSVLHAWQSQSNSNYRKNWKIVWHRAHGHAHTVLTYQEGSLFLWRRAWSSSTQTFITWLYAIPDEEDCTKWPWPRKSSVNIIERFCLIEKELGFIYYALSYVTSGQALALVVNVNKEEYKPAALTEP